MLNLPQANPSGVVIDARGITAAAKLMCISGTLRYPNPWSAISGTYSTVVLLPPGTIYIQQKWVLTDFTQLVGEGSSLTTIEPCTTAVCGSGQAFGTGEMIDMGSSACPGDDCRAVVIEHLGLNERFE
jgi:hypothetical protein